MRNEPRTLLAWLCAREGISYRRFNQKFTTHGVRLFGNSPKNPTCGETQFRRWTGGKLQTLPSPEACQILEAIWPQYTAEQLFGPPPKGDPQAPVYNLKERVCMTAEEALSGADVTASASISDNTIDELRDQVQAVAQGYHLMSPAQAYEATDRLRVAIERQRDRTQIPVQQQELMILNGQAAALLSVAAFNLGYFQPARSLARAAAVFGEAARFTPLQAYADGTLAYIAYHTGNASEAVAKATRALSYGGLGDMAKRRLQAIMARAHAHLGDAVSARRAIQISAEQGQDRYDDLHDGVGGEFAFPSERLALSTSTTALLIGDAERAEANAQRALDLLAQRPQKAQSAHVRAGAAADLAYARLLADDVDGATDALTPVWEVPAEHRQTGIIVRTARIARYLARPVYHGAAVAASLRDQIEEFNRVSPPHRIGPHVGLLAIEG